MKDMNTTILADVSKECLLQSVELEILLNDEHAVFYALNRQNDTVKLVIDLSLKTINVEISMLDNDDIDTIVFKSLRDAVACMKVYSSIQKAYKSRIESLTDLL